MKKIGSIILALLLVVMVSAGCGSRVNQRVEDSVSYPLTIVDSLGEQIVIEKEPQKIVSFSPVITEIICALGAEDNLVGRTSYCDYSESIGDITEVGDLVNTNIEQVVALDPDIIIASSIQDVSSVDQLKALGYTVVSIASEETFDGVYQDINSIGSILNRHNEASEVVEAMKAKVAAVEMALKDVEETPKVYYVVGYGEYGDFTAGGDTFIGQIIKMAKGNNIAEDAQGWSYSLEQVIVGNPKMLIGDVKGMSGIENAVGYKELSAVKGQKIYTIDEDLINRAGPRLAEGLEEMAKIIHPEVF